MKYAVVKVVNGNFIIDSEGYTAIENAIVAYHGVCRALWNASGTERACVMIVNEKMQCVNGYHELIKWDAVSNA